MTQEEIKLRNNLLAMSLEVIKRTEECAKLNHYASPEPELIEQCDPETIQTFTNALYWAQQQWRVAVDTFLECNRQLEKTRK